MPGSSRIPRERLVGDPFFPAIIAAYGAISKGIKIVKGIRAARSMGSGGAPPPMSSMVGMRSPVFGGSSLPIEENTQYIQRVLRAGRGTGHRAPSPPPGLVPPGSRVQVFPAGVAATGRRRYRRMNVCNVHALKRAIRRAKGFEKLARKVLVIPHHFKKHIAVRGRKH